MGSGSASVRVRAHRRRGEEVSASDIRRAKKEEHARQRGLSGAMVGPEELEVLQKKLYPGRFPGMSGRMAAILGNGLPVNPLFGASDTTGFTTC